MRLISHMIQTFNYSCFKRTCYKHHTDIMTRCYTQSFGHMCRRCLAHAKHSNVSSGLCSRTGAAYDLLISGQRRPLFVCSLPVQLRHKFLCVLSLPWQIEREGRVESEGGKRGKTERVCLLEALLESNSTKLFRQLFSELRDPPPPELGRKRAHQTIR